MFLKKLNADYIWGMRVIVQFRIVGFPFHIYKCKHENNFV
jgi:hypothetical protein